MPITSIYHYCSNDAFVSIISSKIIRLSLMDQSNDTEEGRWILRSLKQRINQERDLSHVKDILLDMIEDSVKFLSSGGFCLSEHKDLLSQWRGYADDGQGVSIGFSKLYLEKLGSLISADRSGISLQPVNYGDPIEDDPVIKLLQVILKRAKIWSKCKRGSFLFPATEDEKREYDEARSSLIEATGYLMFISHKFKNPAFSEECEWRLMSLASSFHELEFSLENHYDFRSARNRLIPYRSVPLIDGGEKIINTVVLGPRNISFTEHVSAMLRKCGFHDVEILRSSATYR